MYTGTVLVACMYGAGTGTGGGTVRTGTGPVTGYSASSSFCVVIVFLVTTLLNCLRKRLFPQRTSSLIAEQPLKFNVCTFPNALISLIALQSLKFNLCTFPNALTSLIALQ